MPGLSNGMDRHLQIGGNIGSFVLFNSRPPERLPRPFLKLRLQHFQRPLCEASLRLGQQKLAGFFLGNVRKFHIVDTGRLRLGPLKTRTP